VADPTEIHQILMNLCANAAHAMAEKGGVLDVRLSEAVMESSTLPDPQMEPGRYFQLTVSDTGHGIPPEVVDRIFEPFFSTKEREEGTGLGLSIVHGIVKKLDGAISVDSAPGEGATFHTWLPFHEETAAELGSIRLAKDTRKGKILFVDDEKPIVLTAKALLGRLGYVVAATANPLHALEMVEAGEHRFDLVITDLTMPKMTGVELAKALHSIKPDLPVILCTGFSAAISQDMLTQAGIREVIMKPMIASELSEAIDRVLNAGKGEEDLA
jgi:CheY-like chemotaxis protein/anti-sigma regulatory factor (Ser/Thr protein kinase)